MTFALLSYLILIQVSSHHLHVCLFIAEFRETEEFLCTVIEAYRRTLWGLFLLKLCGHEFVIVTCSVKKNKSWGGALGA